MPPKVEIIEDDKSPAELAYPVDGVYMTGAEHEKLIDARYRRREIKENVLGALIGLPILLALTYFVVWLIKG